MPKKSYRELNEVFGDNELAVELSNKFENEVLKSVRAENGWELPEFLEWMIMDCVIRRGGRISVDIQYPK